GTQGSARRSAVHRGQPARVGHGRRRARSHGRYRDRGRWQSQRRGDGLRALGGRKPGIAHRRQRAGSAPDGRGRRHLHRQGDDGQAGHRSPKATRTRAPTAAGSSSGSRTGKTERAKGGPGPAKGGAYSAEGGPGPTERQAPLRSFTSPPCGEVGGEAAGRGRRIFHLPARRGGRRRSRRVGANAYPLRAAAAFFFATLAGIFRVTSSARLMSAAGAFTRQFPGTTTYPPILCPATGSKSLPPCFLTASISAGGSRRTSSSP